MKHSAVKENDAAPLPLKPGPFLPLDQIGGHRFLVTVDTEEEFDWSAPFARENRNTRHVPHLARFQKQCNDNGVKPVYMSNCAIIEDDAALELLGGFVDDGLADIGLHLHPWLTPPFEEEVNDENSYACNLPSDLERQKIKYLAGNLKSRFGLTAQIFRAGRYGAGMHTPDILTDLGIRIDTSVRPRFDYSNQFGPDFSNAAIKPYWLRDNLIELPVTTVFDGNLRRAGDLLFSRLFRSSPSHALMAKAGLLERIALTPEGIPLEKAIIGIDRALEEEIGILNFSFHSPSAAIGYTPYVRSQEDQENFYDWWDGVYAHLAKCGVKPITVEEIAALKPE